MDMQLKQEKEKQWVIAFSEIGQMLNTKQLFLIKTDWWNSFETYLCLARSEDALYIELDQLDRDTLVEQPEDKYWGIQEQIDGKLKQFLGNSKNYVGPSIENWKIKQFAEYKKDYVIVNQNVWNKITENFSVSAGIPIYLSETIEKKSDQEIEQIMKHYIQEQEKIDIIVITPIQNKKYPWHSFPQGYEIDHILDIYGIFHCNLYLIGSEGEKVQIAYNIKCGLNELNLTNLNIPNNSILYIEDLDIQKDLLYRLGSEGLHGINQVIDDENKPELTQCMNTDNQVNQGNQVGYDQYDNSDHIVNGQEQTQTQTQISENKTPTTGSTRDSFPLQNQDNTNGNNRRQQQQSVQNEQNLKRKGQLDLEKLREIAVKCLVDNSKIEIQYKKLSEISSNVMDIYFENKHQMVENRKNQLKQQEKMQQISEGQNTMEMEEQNSKINDQNGGDNVDW